MIWIIIALLILILIINLFMLSYLQGASKLTGAILFLLAKDKGREEELCNYLEGKIR